MPPLLPNNSEAAFFYLKVKDMLKYTMGAVVGIDTSAIIDTIDFYKKHTDRIKKPLQTYEKLMYMMEDKLKLIFEEREMKALEKPSTVKR